MIYTETTNGAVALKGTGSALVDLFFNIGAARKNPSGIKAQFDAACLNDMEATAAILLFSRDIRHGGAGERRVFRTLLKELITSDETMAAKVVALIPTIGRYDDLSVAYGTALEKQSLDIWISALNSGNNLAFKWADRSDVKLRKALGFKNEAELRKFISKGRKDTTVEQKMCSKNWSMIEFDKLPSVAGIRYAGAFKKNDNIRYLKFIGDAETKVNGAVNFPHDVYRAYCHGGQPEAASKYWKNLAALDVVGNILVMPDVSGSMCCSASGKVTCLDVAVSMGVFLSQRIKGHFNNKMITFSDQPTLVKLPATDDIGQLFEFTRNMQWGGSTNFQAAYEAILMDAVRNKVPSDQMPSHLLVLSDMQFNPVYESGYKGSMWSQEVPSKAALKTVHNSMKEKFASHGYELPKVIYWNLNGSCGNFPVMNKEGNTAVVSGFSPQVLKAVMSAKEFTPKTCMEEAIKPFREMLAK